MIVNMVKIATEAVNIDNAVEFETQAVKQFESKQYNLKALLRKSQK